MLTSHEMVSITNKYDYAQALTTVIGIGAIVIPKLLISDSIPFLTIRERSDKPATGKNRTRGIPQETIKVDAGTKVPESPETTLQALILEELLGAIGVGKIGHHFHTPVSGREIVSLPSLPGKAGRIEVVIYDGNPESLLEYNSYQSETTSPLYLTKLADDNTTRATSRDLLKAAQKLKLLHQGLLYYNLGNTQRVFHPEFNPDQFLRQRTPQPDITSVIN